MVLKTIYLLINPESEYLVNVLFIEQVSEKLNENEKHR